MRYSVLRTALLYAALTGLYILVLDLSLDLLTADVSRHPAARLVLVVATMSLSFFFLSRELQVRWHAEQSLRQTRDELQAHVHERTAGLAEVNKALRAEIVGRQQTEAKLVEAEAKYRTLVEHIPAITYIAAPDETGVTLYISPQIEPLLGFSPADCENNPHFWDTHLHPDDWQRVVTEFTRCGTTGKPFNSEYRAVARDGRVLAFCDEAVLVRGADGQPLCIQGVMFDITPRKQAEEALRQSEETAWGLLNAITDVAFLMDVTGALLAFNEATAKGVGKSMDELLGSCIYDFLAPQVVQVRRAQVNEAIRTRKPVRFEDERDGRLIDSSIYPILDTQGNVARIAIYGRDITVQRQTEKLLMHHALEMEELYKTSLEVNSQFDVPLLLQAIVQRATELIGAPVGGLYLLDPDGRRLELFVGHRMPENRIGVALHLGEGLAGRVAQTASPLMVQDYQTWEGRVAAFADSPYHRTLGVALTVRDKVIGVITVTDEEIGPFDENHVRLLNLFAAQAAIAIENARLYQAEREQRELAETLRDTGATLASTLDLGTVSARLLDQVSRVVPNDAANIMLVEDEHTHPAGWRGYERFGGRDSGHFVFAVDETPYLKHMLTTGQTVVVPDTRSDPLWIPTPGTTWLRSYAAAPIRVQDKTIGFLNVDSATPGFYRAQHAERLKMFADQAAIALTNAQLYQAAQETALRLQTTSNRLLQAQETERRSIARELHDEIGQTLTAVKMNLQAMQRATGLSAQASILDESVTIIEHALHKVRNLSLDLHPSLLDDLGLVPALRWYMHRQAERAGFSVTVVADSLEAHLPPHLEIVCFRIVQEALTNVARHARARHVFVELRQRDSQLELVVRDDGIGFDVPSALERATHGASLGLRGMEERVTLVGGQVEIESVLTHGTEIRARFPLTPLSVKAPVPLG